jgi:gliding motility-associated-like protein
MRKFTLLLFCIVGISLSFFASHGAGGSVAYRHLGGDDYLVTISYIRDCNGIAVSTANRTMTVRNGCGGGTSNYSLPLVAGPIEITQKCDANLPTLGCINNTIGGGANTYSLYQWADTITLSNICEEWYFGFGECCRNGAIVNGPANANFYIESFLDRSQINDNNSSQIIFHQAPIICAGQLNKLSLGIVEADGDSLSFEFVSGLSSPTTNVTYSAPYSATSPIGTGGTINSETGEITITASPLLPIGTYTVVMRISEFEQGQLKGYILYETQFVVTNCSSNLNPVAPSDISNFSGTATQSDVSKIEALPGEQFCFDIVFSDDPLQLLTIETNLDSLFSNATMTIDNSIAGTTIVNVCVIVEPSDLSGVLVFKCKDNFCPFYGFTYYSLLIDVLDCAPNANPIPPTSITNFSGAAIQTGTNFIIGNVGDSFCFDVIFEDALADSIWINSNIDLFFSDASIVQTSFINGQGMATVCIMLDDSSGSTHTINFTATDNGCEFIGQSAFSVTIETIGVIDCPPNSNPVPPASVINFNGTATLVNGTEIEGVFGQTACFDVIFTDALADSIYIYSDMNILFPEATFTQIQFTGGQSVGSFCFEFTDSIASSDTLFIYAIDNSCDFQGEADFAIVINNKSENDSVDAQQIPFTFYSGITPNGDGLNDVWWIDGLPEMDVEVTIINRWGNEVWKSGQYDNLTNVWKGENLEGKPLPSGVYFYRVKINNQISNGFIELTR